MSQRAKLILIQWNNPATKLNKRRTSYCDIINNLATLCSAQKFFQLSCEVIRHIFTVQQVPCYFFPDLFIIMDKTWTCFIWGRRGDRGYSVLEYFPFKPMSNNFNDDTLEALEEDSHVTHKKNIFKKYNRFSLLFVQNRK